MGMNIISAKDHGESWLTLESGRAVAFMMDDALLAGERTTMFAVVLLAIATLSFGGMERHDDSPSTQVPAATTRSVGAVVAMIAGYGAVDLRRASHPEAEVMQSFCRTVSWRVVTSYRRRLPGPQTTLHVSSRTVVSSSQPRISSPALLVVYSRVAFDPSPSATHTAAIE